MSYAERAIRSTAWVAAGTYLKAPVNLAANIVLMRLIAPEHFGVLALAMFFMTLFRKAFGFGFNHALIHRQKDLERVIPTHLALYLVTGAVVFFIAAIAKPIIAVKYGADTAVALLILCAFGIVELGGETPRIMMEKEMRFPPLIKLDLFNILFSNVCAIILAWFGFGLWALVAKQVISWIVQTSGVWKFAPKLPGRVPDWSAAKWFFEFGKPMWWAGIATFISLRFDDFLVGSLDSTVSLGYYARAYALATFPTAMVTHIVGRVAFPLYAKVQNDRDKLSRAFGGVARLIVTLTAPMGVGLAVIAPEIVPLVFGETWIPMIPLMRFLLVYACLRPIYDDCGELFTAVGRPEVSSRILVQQALIVLVTCPLMTWAFSASGAAVSVGASMIFGVVRAYQRVPLYVNFNAYAIFGPPAVACTAATIVTALGLLLFSPEGAVEMLTAKFFLFAASFVIVLVALDGRALWRDFQTLRRATNF